MKVLALLLVGIGLFLLEAPPLHADFKFTKGPWTPIPAGPFPASCTGVGNVNLCQTDFTAVAGGDAIGTASVQVEEDGIETSFAEPVQMFYQDFECNKNPCIVELEGSLTYDNELTGTPGEARVQASARIETAAGGRTACILLIPYIGNRRTTVGITPATMKTESAICQLQQGNYELSAVVSAFAEMASGAGNDTAEANATWHVFITQQSQKPAKQPDPGDTDGDGCSDQQENGANQMLGGLRDYLNPWDFYDTNGDQMINLFNDIFDVAFAFGLTSVDPGYSEALDRWGHIEGGVGMWNIAGPDGNIDLFNDVFSVAFQFGHDCT